MTTDKPNPYSEFFERAMRPDTPRLAHSIDDLKDGQWVVCQRRDGTWGEAIEVTGGGIRESLRESLRQGHPVCPTVILSDPQPEPVTVSREAFDRLAEAVRVVGTHTARVVETVVDRENHEFFAAARALVDEVRQADR